jgi:hypothetical protein
VLLSAASLEPGPNQVVTTGARRKPDTRACRAPNPACPTYCPLVKASLWALLATAAATAAVATACDRGAQDTHASRAGSPTSGYTTTIRLAGKSADIQTGVLTSKTTYVWIVELGNGMELRCVRDVVGNEIASEHCRRVRSR